ncbi:MAG: restriction endonuclease [Ruminiclostridium sp.]|nr:restriction endonuclease [Ruminiclostridium sp.]
MKKKEVSIVGFLKSFLGSMAANAIRDSQKEHECLDKKNSLFNECLEMDIEFNDYLRELGVKDSYSQRAGIYDEGKAAVNAERRDIEQCKKKIEEFISLGGHPENIWYIEKIDDYIAKLKYMISIGYLDQQDDWLQTDMDMLKTLLDQDAKVKKIMQKALAEEEERTQREAFAESIGVDVDNLSGIEFENVCQALVEKMGFTTQTTKASGDGGIDLIAYNHQPLLAGRYIIQCKRYAGSVGEPIIRDLYGVVMSERANKGILMTTGHFTKSAIGFAEGKPIELIDGIKLKELLTKYQLATTSRSSVDLIEFLEQLNDENISLDDEIDSLTILNQFCSYSELSKKLYQDRQNYSIRARMIDLLMQAYLWDNRDYFVYDEVYYEKIPLTGEKYKRCVAQQLREQITWFFKFADEKDPKVQIVKDFYCVYLAEVELVTGNLYNAYRLFDIALKSQTLRKANADCKKDEFSVVWCTEADTISMIVTNMCQILSVLGLKDELKVLMKEYAPLLQHRRNITDDVYQNNPNNPYAKLERNLYQNLHTPMAFSLHNYDEYLETGKMSDNLYDQCMFNGNLSDSTFTTYLETKKVTFSNGVIHIAAVTNPKYPHTSLDHSEILNYNKEKLQNYL